MTLSDFICSIQGKLTEADRQYLDAHPLEDALAEATKLCDNSTDARRVCRAAMHQYIVRMIQDTQQCPGLLTSWVYACSYEYMYASFRGCVGKGRSQGIPGCTFDRLPTRPGTRLVFTLLYNGEPLLFRDRAGGCYSWLNKLQLEYSNLFHPCYQLLTVDDGPARLKLTKRKVDLCYRERHPEYTTMGRK